MSEPEPHETAPILLKSEPSPEQQAEIDRCYELLCSGKPVSEVLEQMRHHHAPPLVEPVPALIAAEPVASEPEPEPVIELAEPDLTGLTEPPSRSGIVWFSLLSLLAVGVMIGSTTSVGHVPAAPIVHSPLVMAPEPPAPPADPAPEPVKQTPMMSAGEIAAMIVHGDDDMARSDVVSARKYYERAAVAGNAEAAMRLAVTYDAEFLARARLNVPASVPLANYWYAVARHGMKHE